MPSLSRDAAERPGPGFHRGPMFCNQGPSAIRAGAHHRLRSCLPLTRAARRNAAPATALIFVGVAALLSAGPMAGQASRSTTTTSAPITPTGLAMIMPHGRDSTDLDTLVAAALVVNPTVRAARQRVQAARARVGPTGLRPDPMLTVGLRDFPLSRPGFYDDFTMKMVGLSQTIPFPGKLGFQRRSAEREVDAAAASASAAARQVERDVRDAYYDVSFMDRALDVVRHNRDLLVNLIKVTEARYGVGAAGQQDVLRARVEASRLAEQAVTLTEQRRAALAQLNAVLDRPSDTPVHDPQVPARIARAAVADSASHVRFVSAALGARADDSPLPSVAELQETAIRESPVLREQEAMIAAQAARVELAGKAHLPDFDLSFEYGQRTGYRDMVTAKVSIPLRLQKRSKQDQLVVSARDDLSALEAEHDARRNEIRANVARLDAELARQRAQLGLYKISIIPQGRASLTSALASYQVGRVEFLTLLENQATLFNYETQYFRVLTDFAKTLAELERVVGKEILQ